MEIKNSGCILVSWDFSKSKDTGVLIVGEKQKNKDVDIINAFQGEEAWDLLARLVTKTAGPIFKDPRYGDN